jgi:hypothetical protein
MKDFEKYFKPDELQDLALFCKKITFESVYKCADAGDYKGTDEEESYRIAKTKHFINAISNLQKFLSDIGFYCE